VGQKGKEENGAQGKSLVFVDQESGQRKMIKRSEEGPQASRKGKR